MLWLVNSSGSLTRLRPRMKFCQTCKMNLSKNKYLITIFHYFSEFDILSVMIFKEIDPYQRWIWIRPSMCQCFLGSTCLHWHLNGSYLSWLCPLDQALSGPQFTIWRCIGHSSFLQELKIHGEGQLALFQDASQKWKRSIHNMIQRKDQWSPTKGIGEHFTQETALLNLGHRNWRKHHQRAAFGLDFEALVTSNREREEEGHFGLCDEHKCSAASRSFPHTSQMCTFF